MFTDSELLEVQKLTGIHDDVAKIGQCRRVARGLIPWIGFAVGSLPILLGVA